MSYLDESPQRVMYQGKLLSQMVVYIQRHGRYDYWCEQGDAAEKIKKCFYRTWFRMSEEEKRNRYSELEETYEIETLLTVDSRKYLIATIEHDRDVISEFSREQQYAAELLIEVFGKGRVKDLEGFLSPIFNPEEVDFSHQENPSSSGYRFFINSDGFIGGLKNLARKEVQLLTI